MFGIKKIFWFRFICPFLSVFPAILVYFRVEGYDFILLDDGVNIYENPLLSHLSIGNLSFFWANSYEHLYIPLTYTLWGLLAGLSDFFTAFPVSAGFRPGVFHVANLGIHLLTTFTLFFILKRALESSFSGKTRIRESASIQTGAFMGALFFSLHPLQVESVCWITEMKGLLSAFFSLLSLYLFLSLALQENKHRRRVFYIASTAFFLLALLSKPSSILLPCIIFVLLCANSKKENAAPLALWLFILIPFAVITKIQQPDIELGYITPWYLRPFIVWDSLSFYTYKVLFPVNLGIDYGRSPQYVLGQLNFGPMGVVLSGAFIALFMCRSRFPFFRYLLIPFFGLLPLLGFVPFLFQKISTVADHYIYLGMMGPALLFSWVVVKTWDRLLWRYFACLALLLLGIQSSMQVSHWKNSLSVFTQAARVNPSSRVAHTNLGKYYFFSGRFSKASFHYETALRHHPDDPVNLSNLGATYYSMGRRLEAEKTFERALFIDPDFLIAHKNLAVILEKQGQYKKALFHLEESLRIVPEDHEAKIKLKKLLALGEGDNKG